MKPASAASATRSGAGRPEVNTQRVRQYTHVFAGVSPHDGQLVSLLLLPEANHQTVRYASWNLPRTGFDPSPALTGLLISD
jgi:hypothetical protein